MDPIIMTRMVSTEPTQIPILIPKPISMATIPNVVPIRWNLISFHCDFT